MAVDEERIASCDCGKVRFKATGKPIVSAVCYCADCQAGGRQLEEAGACNDVRDEWAGTAYLTYRDDRLSCLDGASLLDGFKISDRAPTTRFITTCCKSPMYLKHGPGWWTSVYRVRFGAAAPPLEMRNQTRHVRNREALPRDVPIYRSFPLSLFARLFAARLAMWLGPSRC
jgi:hypothetical protein